MSPGRSAAETKWLVELAATLNERRAQHVYRELREVGGAQGPTLRIENKTYVQFCTNNYLGLANDPEVVEAAREALGKYGAGAGASRLVAGSMELHHRLEEELARFKGTERALVFSTGFMANLAVLGTFAGVGDRIVSDKLNHASLLDAAKFSGAEHRVFGHRNYERARTLLEKTTETRRYEVTKDHEDDEEKIKEAADNSWANGRKFLVTDSVFSMDGDVADMKAVCEVAEGTGALVVVDEAHGTGVLGACGRGLVEEQGVEGRVAVTVGTLSKALGSVGGFVCAGGAAIEMLVNAGRSFIYTTALPPACSGAALAALKIVQRADGAARRERVRALARHVKVELEGMGFDCGDSATPIVPVILGESEKAVRAGEMLKGRGIWVPAIRPPTVAKGTARLRISLMATHTDGQVEQLIEEMRAIRKLI